LSVEITFIRHGQTEGNAAGRWQGHTNSSLTALGREQAARMGRRLDDKHFDLIVASDLDRTVETASALDRPIETDERWREPFFGSWEDRTTAEIAGDGSGGLAALMAGEDVALGGGDRLSEVYLRTSAALADAVEKVGGDGSVAVVSHGMALLTLLSGLIGTTKPSPLRLLGNTAIAELVVDGDRMWMARYNDHTHLTNGLASHFGHDPSDTEVLLVRHGQTQSNTESRWQGHQDGQLNDVGRRQARLLGESFPTVDALYASPLSRAADTAAEIAAAQNLVVTYDDRLKEICFGEWEGLTSAEIADRYPDESRDFFAGIDRPRGGTGETFVQVRARFAAAVEEIASRHPGEKVAVVSHGGVARAWTTEVLGLTYEHRNRVSILGNTGYAAASLSQRGASIHNWNLAPHLEKS
jgi:broad specificity phosphatase PhoE